MADADDGMIAKGYVCVCERVEISACIEFMLRKQTKYISIGFGIRIQWKQKENR